MAVLGASSNPERISNQAVERLLSYGHKVFPIHPKEEEVHGLKVLRKLSDIPEKIHTLTMYVSEKLSTPMTDDILALSPERIIFNPGAENPGLASVAQAQGIETENACTLVLLGTGQFINS